jgi:hypothetical protein
MSKRSSAITNNPRRPRPPTQSKHARNRRVRDIYDAMMIAVEDYADSTLVQGAALRIAELKVISEQLRTEMLAQPTYDKVLGEELVRVENMIRRAEAELDEATPERPETHQQFLRRLSNEQREAQARYREEDQAS